MRFAAPQRQRPTPAGRDSEAVWLSPKLLFALVLLAGAVTVIRTVASLMAANLGVRADQVLVVGVDWPNDEAQAERRLPFLQRYGAALRALPGVQSVGICTGRPGGSAAARVRGAYLRRVAVPEKARLPRQSRHGEPGTISRSWASMSSPAVRSRRAITSSRRRWP